MKIVIIDGHRTFIPSKGVDWLGLRFNRKMDNKLTQKIFDELDRFEKFSTYITKQDAARIAAKIVLEVAEKSYREGIGVGIASDRGDSFGDRTFEDFKKEIL